MSEKQLFGVILLVVALVMSYIACLTIETAQLKTKIDRLELENEQLRVALNAIDRPQYRFTDL